MLGFSRPLIFIDILTKKKKKNLNKKKTHNSGSNYPDGDHINSRFPSQNPKILKFLIPKLKIPIKMRWDGIPNPNPKYPPLLLFTYNGFYSFGFFISF